MTTSTPNLQHVLYELAAERRSQHEKWGEQNHPDWRPDIRYAVIGAAAAKSITDEAAERGELRWADILLEEVAEAFDEAAVANTTLLREELVQVAAVAVAWIEAIDRRVA